MNMASRSTLLVQLGPLAFSLLLLRVIGGDGRGSMVAAAAAGDQTAVKPQPPHLLLFVLDDVGWNDVGTAGRGGTTTRVIQGRLSIKNQGATC